MKTKIECDGIKMCPLCHAEGRTYDAYSCKPQGIMMTMKSLPQHSRYWIECSCCQLRTKGHRSIESALGNWNHREGERLAKKEREDLIRSALDLLGSMNYSTEEVFEERDIIWPR